MSKWDKRHVALKNNLTYLSWFSFLYNLVTTRYKWNNLPDSMDEKFLEKSLFEDGKAVLINHPQYGFLNLRCSYSDTLNIYELPTEVNAYSLDLSIHLPLNEVAIVFNNNMNQNDKYRVIQYAIRLYECSRTIDTNIKVQKTPLVIVTDSENKKLTLKNMFMQYDGNEHAIFSYKELLDEEPFRVLNLNAPFIANQVHDIQNSILNEFLTIYGLNNANTDKRERLTNDEVNANNQLISLSSDIGLICREQAAEKFNNLYGTNITVERRENINVSIYNPIEMDYREQI